MIANTNIAIGLPIYYRQNAEVASSSDSDAAIWMAQVRAFAERNLKQLQSLGLDILDNGPTGI